MDILRIIDEARSCESFFMSIILSKRENKKVLLQILQYNVFYVDSKRNEQYLLPLN